MTRRASFAGWYRHRYLWVAVILLTVLAGAGVLHDPAGPKAHPADLETQVMTRMRTTLEQSGPERHHHAGHGTQQMPAADYPKPPVVCGVRVYGYEPAAATTLAEVRTVYGFHLCGVAEHKRPWDVAVKLAGPVIMNMSTDPVGIQAVEASAGVKFVDRLRKMFPTRYADLALKEALSAGEMTDLHRRYEAAAGL